MSGMGNKGYRIVPQKIARRIGHLSKIGALELAYSLAGRLAASSDDVGQVYDVMRREWSTVAGDRGDRPLPLLEEE